MQRKSSLHLLASLYIGFSAISIGAVSLLALLNPQQVMDLVSVKLGNTDALSSIRGVYGGVGLFILFVLLRVTLDSREKAVSMLAFFWGAYAASRLLTILADGSLGAFGTQWLVIESVLLWLALGLSRAMKQKANDSKVIVES